jgi:hypothetical protein
VSLGLARATTLTFLGLRKAVIRLIVPPLPAASRPSKMARIRSPFSFMNFCSFISSICSFFSSISYSICSMLIQTGHPSLLFLFVPELERRSPPAA